MSEATNTSTTTNTSANEIRVPGKPPVYNRSGSNSPNIMQKIQLPSPIITRRTRTASTSARALKNPIVTGVVKSFCRTKGHGFITPNDGGEDIFCHISDIEGEYVPMPGDEVKYRLCAVPPKNEKYQAVHVRIINYSPEVHHKWEDSY